jgi:hypothetical protein
MAHATSDSFTSTNGWHVNTVASFNVLMDGRGRSRQAEATEFHVPWANLNVIHVGGVGTEKLELALYVPSDAEMSDLLNCVGDSGTLVYAEGTFTAFCSKVEVGEYFLGGEQTAKAEFWIV